MTETEGYVDQSVMGLEAPQPMYKALRESTPVFRSPQSVVLSAVVCSDQARSQYAARCSHPSPPNALSKWTER